MADDNSATDDGYRIDRRTALKLASVAGVGAIFSGTALADDGADDTVAIDPERTPPWDRLDGLPDRWATDRWFVEFEERPTVRGGTPNAHANERAKLRSQARREDVRFAERHDFTTLWNGLSVTADLTDAVSMSGFEGVEAVYPVAVIDRPVPEDAAPDLDSALAMTGADAVQSERGTTGAGKRVAIVDSGIDYNHPDLGGDGDPETTYTAVDADDRTLTGSDGQEHPRISHGWDYVGAEYDASDPETGEPNPNPDPMDPQGHGTHVAGIVGADAADEDGVTGVAPETTLGAYKIFGAGSSSADIIVAAMEDAYEDGMDIVNMSLGATLAWGQEYPTTAASNELVDQGVVVVNSAGNDGGLGAWSMSAPANAHDVITVASAENTHLEAQAFDVEHGDEQIPYLELTGAEVPPVEGESAPLALPSESEIDGETGYFGCDPDDFAEFPDGRVALIERGHCTFAQKYQNAVAAGASGVVIFNNVSGLFSGTIQDAGVDGVWGAGISDSNGAALADRVAAGEDVTLEFTDETVTVPNPDGGLLSDFSSYGQDVELAFGPSVTAPGGLITSTYPLAQDEYAMLSGTSMSAPHVAGVVALLLAAEPDLDPLEVRDRLQNTADPSPWSLAPDAGFLDHSFRQGAGMVQIDAAIDANQHVTPGQIPVGDGAGTTTMLTIRNEGDEDVEYEIGHTGTLGIAGNTFEPTFQLPGSSVDAPAAVTVPAGSSVDVEATIDAPEYDWPNHQYGGYVEFVPNGEDAATLRVPYAGYDGDYQELPLFGYYDETEFVEREPTLATVVDETEDGTLVTESVDSGHQFTVADGELPIVEAFFGHFPQEMRLYAVDQKREREYLVMEEQYLSRSPDTETVYRYPWSGMVQAGRSDNTRPVPKGRYTIRVEVLRALGDPENPDHWETWESPEFELDTRRAKRRAATPESLPAAAGE